MGDVIRELRDRFGMDSFRKKVNMSQAHIYRYEKNEVIPNKVEDLEPFLLLCIDEKQEQILFTAWLCEVLRGRGVIQ